MTRRERLTAIHRGETPDRPAVKLWGARPDQKLMHSDYAPVYTAAIEFSDLVLSAGAAFNIHAGRHWDELQTSAERATDSPEWIDVVSTVRVPGGTVRSINTRSTVGKPGYCKEHFLKAPADLERFLSLPYEAAAMNTADFLATERDLGDRGITMFGLDHAMYAVQRLIGSENFALWSLEARDLLYRGVELYSQRILDHVNAVFDAGLTPIFGWVGPELCIPPLMSPADFDDLVFPFDQALIDLIHARGGHVWVHSHGKMGPVLERFVSMGVDVLNPIEPPPMGDITLAEAFGRVGSRMGLEGNIETHDLMTASSEHVIALIDEALAAGAGQRFILCPSSGYMEWPTPEPRHIANLVTFVKEGVRRAAALG